MSHNPNKLLPALLAAGLCMAVILGTGQASAQTVNIETNKGTIVVQLDPEAAPVTVKNFLAYVNSGFYTDTVFHRVIKDFMIQGGGYDPQMVKKETMPPIVLEVGKLSNARGTIAMARTGDPNSATSQFFINHADNTRLDTLGGGYAVFGKVTQGMQIVDAIATTPTTAKGSQANLPVEPVIIKSIKVAKVEAKKKPRRINKNRR